MAGIVFGGIAPHGFSIIGEIAGEEYELFRPTREGMEEFGRKLKETSPDTIVILTPHGLRLKGYNAVYTCEVSRGTLSQNNKSVYAEFNCDRELALDILKRIEAKNMPVVGANFGALSGPASCIEMDWGTLIPLWFCGAQDEKKPEIVIIAPTREIPLNSLVELGRSISEAAVNLDRRVALIASADQGHCHDANGPYGYDEASAEYDELIQDIIREDKLVQLLDMDLDFVERAKPDSLWQMLILYGAIMNMDFKPEILSYQVPTYFGMLAAVYSLNS
jgi:aromatic ring-opening dioxygenase LigB subunit